MAEAESKPKETKTERYLRQMEQIQTLREQAVEELLEKRREIDDQLKTYRVRTSETLLDIAATRLMLNRLAPA